MVRREGKDLFARAQAHAHGHVWVRAQKHVHVEDMGRTDMVVETTTQTVCTIYRWCLGCRLCIYI